jgi:nitroreductase
MRGQHQTGTDRNAAERLLETCVALAIHAPSSHNTQPWHFRVKQECIELVADRSRALPVSDPEDRELTINCGAALFTLRVAAASRGYSAIVDILPVPNDADLLARVTPLTGLPHDIHDAAVLADAIRHRRTYRKAFLREVIPAARVQDLQSSATQEGATLVVLDDESSRRRAVDLVEQADRKLWEDPHWRRELGAWMHPRRRGEGFGIPGLALAAAQMVARSFDIGGGVQARGDQILDGSPLLVLLCTPADTPADWLAAGQAMQHVLLQACTSGLQASFLNQPLHLPELRQQVRHLAPEAGVPQLLLRLGRPAEQLAPVVRRPVEQVLDFDWMGH